MYSMLTVAQLKEALRKINAKTTGKKADLLARLEAYDYNFNSVETEDNEEDQMYVPSDDRYRDINADTKLPPLSKHHIQTFTERFNKKSGNALQMYENRHLLTARSVTVGDYTYIKGQCKASMKKICYVVDIKLRNSCGSIEETHCECAVGSGCEAHCKHVLILLYGTEHMVRNKCLLLHQVCTQKLMTFKKPKPFYASPVKCEDLPIKKKRPNVNYEPLNNDDIPISYNEYVRNLFINYGATSAPIKQTFIPANTYAVEWDHSFYLKKSGKDYTLERLFLRNVSSSQIAIIEENTRGQNQCKMWKKFHETHLTASNFHAIYTSKDSHKTHLCEKIISPKEFHSKATKHGQMNEQFAIAKFEEMYGVEVRRCGMFLSETHPFLAASPDGLFGEDAVVEVKCPYSARYREINPVTVPYIDIDITNGELILKNTHPYFAQVQGQLFCSGKKYCIFIIFTLSHLQTIYIARNEEFIKEMEDKLSAFYNEHFKIMILDKHLYKNYSTLFK